MKTECFVRGSVWGGGLHLCREKLSASHERSSQEQPGVWVHMIRKSEYDKVVQQLNINKCTHKYHINGRCTDCKESLYDLRGF